MRFQGSELDVLQVEPDVGLGPTVKELSETYDFYAILQEKIVWH